MPDWESLLREKLGAVCVRPERLDEIVAEIAAHLESAWQEQGGSPPARPAAFLQAQLGDAAGLRARIERAEGSSMHERYRHFWMPAFFAVLAAQLAETVLTAMTSLAVAYQQRALLLRIWRAAPLDRMPRAANLDPAAVYYGYLLALAAIGGAASFIARRRGASRPIAILAGIVPILFCFLPYTVGSALLRFSFLSFNVLTMEVLPILLTLLLAILLSRVPVRGRGRNQEAS